SPAASDAATRDRHSPNGQHSTASASEDRNVAPTFRSASDPASEGTLPLGVAPLGATSKRDKRHMHLSSAHSVPNDNASHEGLNEDNTEEPALVGAGSTTRRGN